MWMFWGTSYGDWSWDKRHISIENLFNIYYIGMAFQIKIYWQGKKCDMGEVV